MHIDDPSKADRSVDAAQEIERPPSAGDVHTEEKPDDPFARDFVLAIAQGAQLLGQPAKDRCLKLVDFEKRRKKIGEATAQEVRHILEGTPSEAPYIPEEEMGGVA